MTAENPASRFSEMATGDIETLMTGESMTSLAPPDDKSTEAIELPEAMAEIAPSDGCDAKEHTCQSMVIEGPSLERKTEACDQMQVEKPQVGVVATNDPPMEIPKIVDLDKLCELLEKNQHAGDCIEGKDILLFIGDTGSGKTSTILYLAGASFTEVEDLDGFDHFEPSGLDSQILENFKTSCGAQSVTACLRTISVPLDGDNVILCDSPGFNDTDSVEAEISNGVGLIQGIHRAKSVKVVLVLNSNGSDRFNSLSCTLNTVLRLLGQPQDVDFSSFDYVFPRCSDKDATRIHKRLGALQSNPSGLAHGDGVFLSLVNDMIVKTTPRAENINLLSQDNATTLLRRLGQSKHRISDVRATFKPFVSPAVLHKLSCQVHSMVQCLHAALSTSDFELAGTAVGQLYRIDQIMMKLPLPDVSRIVQEGFVHVQLYSNHSYLI